MPVRSVKNQYLGINAHLHSFWQGEGKWNRFHNYHIGQTIGPLRVQLIPMGYTAQIEESLQIRRVGDSPGRPHADILISDLDSKRAFQSPVVTSADTQTLALEELIEEEEDKEHPYSAIGIYERPSESGEPVAWIELLSPSNKGGSLDARTYREKRRQLLLNGVVFVELDYLHETPPTFWRLADYTQNEPNAHAYRIVVLDPRPNFTAGRAHLREFDVDAPIPAMIIPLNSGDKVEFDFGRVYQKSYEEILYGYDMDYAELPMNFDRYGSADQTRIARRMVAVLQAVHNGVDLETGPFPVKDMELEAALAQLETLRNQLAERTG
jgi:hypothetical protein